MKKILACVTVLVVLAAVSTSLHAVNLFGNVGLAASDLDGLFFDVGAEVKITNNFYGQVLFDYYFNPAKEDIAGLDDSAYGFNLYGVYKFTGSGPLNLFAKAGVHYTIIKMSVSGGGISISAESKDFGIGGGLGVEYSLSEQVALVLGATAKLIFFEGDTGNWFKFYGGINFRL
jgi:opacity protein-like surface antigen